MTKDNFEGLSHEELERLAELLEFEAITSINRSRTIVEKYATGYLQTISLLAGGGLVLSISFLGHLADQATPTNQWFLFLSWASWSLALILILIHFRFGRDLFDYQSRQIEHEFIRSRFVREGLEDPVERKLEPTNYERNLWITAKTGLWSGILTITGVISMVLFAVFAVLGLS